MKDQRQEEIKKISRRIAWIEAKVICRSLLTGKEREIIATNLVSNRHEPIGTKDRFEIDVITRYVEGIQEAEIKPKDYSK